MDDVVVPPGYKRKKVHRTITDDKHGRTVEFKGKANYKRQKAMEKARKARGVPH